MGDCNTVNVEMASCEEAGFTEVQVKFLIVPVIFHIDI